MDPIETPRLIPELERLLQAIMSTENPSAAQINDVVKPAKSYLNQHVYFDSAALNASTHNNIIPPGVIKTYIPKALNALKLAIYLSAPAWVKILLEAGADPNIDGLTHLNYCLEIAYTNYCGAVNVRMQASYDIAQHPEAVKDKPRYTVYENLCWRVLETLLQFHKTDINKLRKGPNDCFVHTVTKSCVGWQKIFLLLRAKNVDFTAVNYQGYTALLHAVMENNLNMVRDILKGGNATELCAHVRADGFNILYAACEFGDIEVIEAILKYADPTVYHSVSPLYQAATKEDPVIRKKMVALLLANGADPDAISYYDQVAIHAAVNRFLDDKKAYVAGQPHAGFETCRMLVQAAAIKNPPRGIDGKDLCSVLRSVRDASNNESEHLKISAVLDLILPNAPEYVAYSGSQHEAACVVRYQICFYSAHEYPLEERGHALISLFNTIAQDGEMDQYVTERTELETKILHACLQRVRNGTSSADELVELHGISKNCNLISSARPLLCYEYIVYMYHAYADGIELDVDMQFIVMSNMLAFTHSLYQSANQDGLSRAVLYSELTNVFHMVVSFILHNMPDELKALRELLGELSQLGDLLKIYPDPQRSAAFLHLQVILRSKILQISDDNADVDNALSFYESNVAAYEVRNMQSALSRQFHYSYLKALQLAVNRSQPDSGMHERLTQSLKAISKLCKQAAIPHPIIREVRGITVEAFEREQKRKRVRKKNNGGPALTLIENQGESSRSASMPLEDPPLSINEAADQALQEIIAREPAAASNVTRPLIASESRMLASVQETFNEAREHLFDKLLLQLTSMRYTETCVRERFRDFIPENALLKPLQSNAHYGVYWAVLVPNFVDSDTHSKSIASRFTKAFQNAWTINPAGRGTGFTKERAPGKNEDYAFRLKPGPMDQRLLADVITCEDKRETPILLVFKHCVTHKGKFEPSKHFSVSSTVQSSLSM